VKGTRELELCSHEEKLRELGFFSLEKKKLWRDLLAAFQYFKVAYKREED